MAPGYDCDENLYRGLVRCKVCDRQTYVLSDKYDCCLPCRPLMEATAKAVAYRRAEQEARLAAEAEARRQNVWWRRLIRRLRKD